MFYHKTPSADLPKPLLLPGFAKSKLPPVSPPLDAAPSKANFKSLEDSCREITIQNEKGDFSGAVSDTNHAVIRLSAEPRTSAPLCAKIYLQRALALRRDQLPTESVQAAEAGLNFSAHAIEPESLLTKARLQSELGLALIAVGNADFRVAESFEAAIQTYLKYLDVIPTEPPREYAKGLLSLATAYRFSARAHLQLRFSTSPGMEDALLASACYNFEQASAAFVHVFGETSLDAQITECECAQALLRAGQPSVALSSLEQARERFDQRFAGHPLDAPASEKHELAKILLEISAAHADLGQLDQRTQTWSDLRKVVATIESPDADFFARYSRCDALQALGENDPVRASDSFEKALDAYLALPAVDLTEVTNLLLEAVSGLAPFPESGEQRTKLFTAIVEAKSLASQQKISIGEKCAEMLCAQGLQIHTKYPLAIAEEVLIRNRPTLDMKTLARVYYGIAESYVFDKDFAKTRKFIRRSLLAFPADDPERGEFLLKALEIRRLTEKFLDLSSPRQLATLLKIKQIQEELGAPLHKQCALQRNIIELYLTVDLNQGAYEWGNLAGHHVNLDLNRATHRRTHALNLGLYAELSFERGLSGLATHQIRRFLPYAGELRQLDCERLIDLMTLAGDIFRRRFQRYRTNDYRLEAISAYGIADELFIEKTQKGDCRHRTMLQNWFSLVSDKEDRKMFQYISDMLEDFEDDSEESSD